MPLFMPLLFAAFDKNSAAFMKKTLLLCNKSSAAFISLLLYAAFKIDLVQCAASVVTSRRFWNAVSDQYLRFVCVCRVGARRI